jgi:hypothetical protein
MNEDQFLVLQKELRALRSEVSDLRQSLQPDTLSAGDIVNLALLAVLVVFILWLLWIKVLGKNFYRGAREAFTGRHRPLRDDSTP